MAKDDAPIQEGPGKGQAFFKHAKTAAGSGNFDFAINLYIEGLLREPDNVPEHQALYEVSLRRKASGGKTASGLFGPKLPCKGKAPKDQMLNAEFQLANDPGTINLMLTVMRQASAAGYDEVVRWITPIVLLANKAKPRKDICMEAAEIYEKLNNSDDLSKALECVRSAIEIAPNDMALLTHAKNIAAKLTLMQGQYEEQKDFKESLKSKEQTKDLLQEENLAKSEDYRLKILSQAKTDYDANPMEHQVISKYGKALQDMDEEGYENEAIELYLRAYKETKTYRYKSYVGDIRIKQFNRNARMLKEALKADPDDKSLAQHIKELAGEQLAFELEEYKERIHNYPTDMSYQYQYGVRLYNAKRYDEAIGALQTAQNSPKHRADALYVLGRCFTEQGMKPEAIETLQRAISGYDLAQTGDTKSKEMHYWLARGMEDTNKVSDAIGIYSKIAQWDYNFRDVRARLDALRKKLEGGNGG